MSSKGSIVQELHEIQDRCGYLPKSELEALARRRKDIPRHRFYEVASFFPHFRLESPPAVSVLVCRDMACHLRGAPELRRVLTAQAEELGGAKVRIEGVSCLGQCDGAPAMVIADRTGDHVHRLMNIEEARALVRQSFFEVSGTFGHDHGPTIVGPTGWRIDPYEGREDYGAVRKYVGNPDPDGLIEQLKIADLRGMGGAGVWAHQKWKDVRQARGDTKYIVVNGDESEPGTFKDRELLLRTPHVVIEGVVLAGLLTGAERGYIYIRHEYEEQIAAVRAALKRAQAMGIVGSNVLGSGKSFPVEVFVSPGGYICGEQSALIEAMEDHRAEPRNKPPQLETNGLYDKPTLVSNVETYAWVPSILWHGGAWYREQGINGANGLRFFSLCGDVERPGVYEVPCGVTLRSLIEDYAGGMLDGQTLKAFASSGPSGGFLPATLPRQRLSDGFTKRLAERELLREGRGEGPPDANSYDTLELELDLQTLRELGYMLGAGLVVYGDRADMLNQAVNATEFYRNESCGKCVPCRLGSQKLVELGNTILRWHHDEESIRDVESLMTDLQHTMEMSSICGLGMVAGNPIISVFRHFRADLEVYLRGPQLRTLSDMDDLYTTRAEMTGLFRTRGDRTSIHESLTDISGLKASGSDKADRLPPYPGQEPSPSEGDDYEYHAPD